MEKAPLLNDEELARTRRRFRAAQASLACEGMYLTDEELALFRSFEEQRLPHDERRRRLIEFSRSQRAAPASSAAE